MVLIRLVFAVPFGHFDAEDQQVGHIARAGYSGGPAGSGTARPATLCTKFGRGLISEVGGKILDTFAGCLSGKLAPSKEPAPATGTATQDAPAAVPAQGKLAKDAPAGDAAAAPAAAAAAQPVAEAAAKPVPDQGAPAAEPTATSEPVAKPQPAVKPAPTTPEINTEPKAKPAERPVLHSVPAPPETEAIDLLDYAGQSVLKRVLPVLVAVAAVVGLVAIVRALRR